MNKYEYEIAVICVVNEKTSKMVAKDFNGNSWHGNSEIEIASEIGNDGWRIVKSSRIRNFNPLKWWKLRNYKTRLLLEKVIEDD